VVYLNHKLFPDDAMIDNSLLRRFIVFIIAAFAVTSVPAIKALHWTLPVSTAVAVATTLLLAVAAYATFRMDELRVLLMSKFKKKRPAEAA
ncbi:MAG TPA: hypothetical protein VIM67_06900, partial [Terriglobus sp.]